MSLYVYIREEENCFNSLKVVWVEIYIIFNIIIYKCLHDE